MAKTLSNMLPLGTTAPSFRLPDTNTVHWEGLEQAPLVSLTEVVANPASPCAGVLVAFLCNHCPYVKHVRAQFARLTGEWIQAGLGVVGISSNDVANYPDDSPAKMWAEAKEASYHFPYLYDETQAVAHAYRAACTPDFYLFDADLKLVYRGQFDESRPGNGKPVTGQDLDQAVRALLANKPIKSSQLPSLGCNIKWKPGNEPAPTANF